MKPEKKTGWININSNNMPGGYIFSTEQDAILARSPRCVATVKIEWEE